MSLVLRVFAVVALLASAAWAQTTPRVLVIFDTSGSMLWDYEGGTDCRGDGSNDFPHTNPACQLGSRMFHAKQALFRIVQQTDGVEFGLMRYGQLEPGDAGFGQQQQQVGAQYRDGAGNLLDINYDGSTNGCGPADLLVDPSPASEAAVLRWLDNRENYPADKELRANGYTPLTFSMQSAREALLRIIADDPEADCRPYYVLLLTDGYQQCPGEDASDAAYRARVARELEELARGLRNLRVQGARAEVRTFVVGFGPGTAFATELDQMARAGGTAVDANGRPDLLNGTAYQANDPAGLVAALGQAVGNARPRELCDGDDNDCDGRTDEDFPQLGRPCSVGSGECRTDGVIQCAADGSGTVCSADPGDAGLENCNGLDDDCDGQVDEGVRNRCGDCGPEPGELCNGLDDDCDGAVDEGTLNA
ncbi:MAG: VWA domain-containing protein, partial [Myxococcales bacterium]|nr:VWA domain-containing protein [Myxococcales bacterium]